MAGIVVLPTYNEFKNLAPMVEGILGQLSDFHILIVDDNSPDGTGALADQLRQENPQQIFVLHRPIKEGLGQAYLAAFRFCLKNNYEKIIQMDADFSHPLSLLRQLVNNLDHYDLVLGSRYIPGGGVSNWGYLRRMISKAGNRYAGWALKQKISDLTGGYKAFNSKVLKFLVNSTLFTTGYAFQIETTVRIIGEGFSYQELPFVFQEREAGSSKMSRKDVLEGFLKVFQLRRELKQLRNSKP